jgi:uncharacterized membrane protein
MQIGILAARITMLSYIVLLGLYTMVTIWFPPEGKQPHVVVWLVHVLPLLLFVQGVFKIDKRSLAYLCFAILLYFLIAVDNAFSPVARIWEYAIVAAIVSMFTAATVAIRCYSLPKSGDSAHD